MPNNQDRGGIWALAGFLYQIVGMLSLTVDIFETPSWDDFEESYDTLFLLPSADSFFEAIHEHYGQDASYVSRDDETVLVQFKYSSNETAIYKKELKEIIEKLVASAESVASQGLNVTACVLATNRPLAGAATEYWKEESSDKHDFDLVYLHNSMKSWIVNLKDFGKSYGASEGEIRRSINSLVGRVVEETGRLLPRVTITIEDLVEAIVEYRNAKPITAASVASYTSKELALYREHDRGLRDPLVRRGLLDDISVECARSALIILHGKGGCGKTTSMWQWINNRPFVAFATANDVSANWLSDEMCNWANLPPDHRWRLGLNSDQVISRIREANPNHSIPILHLALDGLDEELAQVNQQAIKKLIRSFWDLDNSAKATNQPPEAALIVTCRELEGFEKEWLSLDVSGFDSDYEVSAIQVDIFSDDELKEAIQNTPSADIDDKVRNQITQALDLPASSFMVRDFASSFRSFATQTRTVDPMVLKAIHHPSVFRAFLLIESKHQLGVLTNESSAFSELANKYVDRFCRKILHRGKIQAFRREVLNMVLRNVAISHSCDTADAPWHSHSGWVHASVKDGHLRKDEAKQLYLEALSGGLIFEDSPNLWQWTYCWVRDYLTLDTQ